MTNIVELLTSFLEQVTPSKDLKPEQWSTLISTVKSNLKDSKDHISNSPDPFVEGFFTILNSFVSNKYGAPETSSDGQNTFNRLGSVSSQSSTNSNASSDATDSTFSSTSSFGFLENFKEYRNLAIGSKSSKDGSGKKRGYSALFETLKRVFSKERMEKRRREEKPGKWRGVSTEIKESTPVEKSPVKRQRKGQGKQREEQTAVREPYTFRSGASKGGKGASTRSLAESPRRELKGRRESQGFETSRETLREEPSGRVPPLDLRSLQPHEHLTTPESSVVSRNEPFESASTSRERGVKASGRKELKEKSDSSLAVNREKSMSTPLSARVTKEPGSSSSAKVQSELERRSPQNKASEDDEHFESSPVQYMAEEKETQKEVSGKQTTLQESEPIYKPLQSLVESKQRVDMYVVAVEMIRTVVTTIDTTREMFNYRAIDPSVFQTNNSTEYSVQIMFSDPKKQYHVSFGDVLRLKRADTFLVTDKYGKRYINIIMSLKNRPSMRLWNANERRDVETGRLFIDFNKPSETNREGANEAFGTTPNWEGETEYNDMDNNNNNNSNRNNNSNSNNNTNNRYSSQWRQSQRDEEHFNSGQTKLTGTKGVSQSFEDQNLTQKSPESAKDRNLSNGNSSLEKDDSKNELERTKESLKNEAVVLYYDSNVSMTDLDAYIINFLRNWSRKLDPLEVLSNSGFLRSLSEASDTPYDFIVKVLKVCPDYTFLVADSTSKALVTNLSPMLSTNLFESANPIQKGDWIKLRSFVRVFNESNRFLKLSASRFSCVTRIPNIDKKVIGEDESEGFQKILVRERRVNLDTWTRTSCLNDSFPKRFKRSKYFIQKLLSTQPTVTFQKASPIHVSHEKEEGEISQ